MSHSQNEKECPFCGDAELEIVEEVVVPGFFAKVEYYALCLYCGARGPTQGNELSAVRSWNSRIDQ